MGKILKGSKASAKPRKEIISKADSSGRASGSKHSKTKKGKKSHILKLSKPTVSIRKIISKKEKQKIKSQKVLKKIELTQNAFKEDKARMKRQKTAVVGDLKPLLDSLPALDELLTLRDTSQKTGISSIDRRIHRAPKNKQERRQFQLNEKTEKMLDRFDHVQKLWRDPEFQQNPRKMIAEKLRLRRLANEMET